VEFRKKVDGVKSLMEFDSVARAPIFGYKSAHALYRDISCNSFIPNIKTPVFVISTKDDEITRYEFVPDTDLKRNPNIMHLTYNKGGHCDLWYKDEVTGKHKEYGPELVFAYFDQIGQNKL